MKLTIRIRLGALGTLILIGAVRPALCDDPLTVCETLARLSSLNGKEVSVRGEWHGHEHGQALLASDGKCPIKLATGPHEWLNGINLIEDKSGKMNYEAISLVTIKLQDAHYDPAKQDAIVTVVGRLESGLPKSPYPQTGPYGFGHLNALPARIHYRSISDLELRTRTTKAPPKVP